MNTFRPIVDVWLLGRPKVKYYGAYPSGFLERARALLGVGYTDPVLHVCGGRVRDYPFRGFGPNDRTVDLDPELAPDFLMDVRRLGVKPGDLFPFLDDEADGVEGAFCSVHEICDPDGPEAPWLWPAVLADPPYSHEDAQHYAHAGDAFPARADLLRRCLSIVRPGGRVGFLDVIAPRPPKHGVRFVAAVPVLLGFGNQVRIYSVYERETEHAPAARARAMRAIRGQKDSGS